jgi:hypothetical protein
VEGVHDVEFLRRISRLVHTHDGTVPDLARWELEGLAVFIPIGGGNFLTWANRLAPLGRPTFFLLDRDRPPYTAEREQTAAALNQRRGCAAIVTMRRSVDNYLAPTAIHAVCSIDIAIDADSDVATELARKVLAATAGSDWEELSRRARQRLRNRIKKALHSGVVERMSFEMLTEHDPNFEVIGWLRTIAKLARDAHV